MKKSSFFNVTVLVALVALAFNFTACKKDKHNHEELITKVELHDHDNNVEYAWEDKEGDGNPTIDTVKLKVGQKVEFELHLYDGSDGHNHEITAEIRSEGADHLVVYSNPSSSLQITTLDTDANGKALGLKSEWNPQGAGATTVTVVLKHKPNKDAADPSTTGDSDIEVSFPVVITQ
jgi:hypothetical protein